MAKPGNMHITPGPLGTLGRALFCLLALGPWCGHLLAGEDGPEHRYQEALAQARAGDLATALPVLKTLADSHPERPAYLYDYITVLGWAEQDREALALLPRVNRAQAPPYVLASLAKSARNLKRYAEAEALYRGILARHPHDRQALAGLAMTLADMGRGAEAVGLLEAAAARGASETILLAWAYALYRQGDYFGALDRYEATLSLDPGNRDARRGRILVTARLGAPHLAAAMAAAEPGLLNAGELQAIEADRTAITIRWGRLPHGGDTPPHAETDQAIAALEARLAAARGEDALKARYDLMAAYLDRLRPARVIALYESLPASDRPRPPYVLATAAEAYLQLHQPEQARDLIRQALGRKPDDFDMNMLLVHALVECEQLDEARQLADRLAAAQPAWLGRRPAPIRENPKRLEADSTAALVRAYGDDLQAAQRRLDALADRAPHNARLRADRGHVYLWRGWPRRAMDEFRVAHAIDPHLLAARTGASEALRETTAYDAGRALLAQLQEKQAEQPMVRELARHWALHDMRRFYLSSGYSDSTGNAVGGRNFDLDAWLYDRPRREHYRPFLHGHLETARFPYPERSEDYRRIGAGLEYRRPSLMLQAELNRDLGTGVNAGLSLRGQWRPDDHWRIGAGYDSYSNDVPLLGRLNENLDGWGIDLNVGYRFHESRRLDTGIQYLDFSDGNQRRSLSASLAQRLRTRPHYKLDGVVDLYTSRNDRDDAPYFNPGRDFSLDLSLENEWLILRRYERSFRHRLALTLGLYEQQDHGTHPTWGLRYEQQWNRDDQTEVRYGVSYLRRVYDGDAEDVFRIHLILDRRF